MQSIIIICITLVLLQQASHLLLLLLSRCFINRSWLHKLNELIYT